MSGGDMRGDNLTLMLDAARQFVERYHPHDDAVQEVIGTANAQIESSGV